MSKSENILVVPTPAFHNLGLFQGFSQSWQKYRDGLLKPEFVSFKPRSAMETDATYKQIIPYCVFVCHSQGLRTMLRYTRAKFDGQGETEKRLLGKDSVGIGGHINDEDMQIDLSRATSQSIMLAYELALQRELKEEVNIDLDPKSVRMKMIGVINDDSNDVGSVHLGFVHLIEVVFPCVYPKERGLTTMFFQEFELLASSRADTKESWTQIVLNEVRQSPKTFMFQ